MNYPERAFLYADVIRRLGIKNVAYVAWYRFSIKAGFRKWFFPPCQFQVKQDFFRPAKVRADYQVAYKASLLADAQKIIEGGLRYYARHWKSVGNPPGWFLNPFNGARYPNPKRHWTVLKDFDPAVGDIKNIWEASRFEWAVTLARAYAGSGDAIYLQTLNQWLRDWAAKNPVNVGPNWKCGQEASIRIFNLIQAALILNQWDHPTATLMEFIHHHLGRIHANILYAIAQDNNHGTSEAAALFIGGQWLAQTEASQEETAQGEFYARQGRKWLENRIEKLVEADGSFSQHSVTYHRVLLDTLIFVECWRRKLNADRFSEMFYQRATAAMKWMELFTDPDSGGAPNLGANDGSLLLNTHSCDYRDFRPSTQAASILFRGKKVFGRGPWDEPSYWFGLEDKKSEKDKLEKDNAVLPGGYVIMVGKNSWSLLRFPMYRFRPSHNDVFHFDLWWRGQNICRDGGSYSYNAESERDASYFTSVKAHNTVSFDDHAQMPRLRRFLPAKWIQPEQVGSIEVDEEGCCFWTGAYKDYRGNRHQRTVRWQEDTWVVEDDLAGPFETAEIRYRLIPAEYRVEGSRVIAPWGSIEVVASDCQIRMEEGLESLFYWEKKAVDILVLSVGRSSGKITSRFLFE
jgi:hypothetical protein